jgi:uncharacterized protein DUF1579
MSTSFEMPVPGPPHERLAQLVGEWSGEEVLHPSQWDPDGGTAAGRYSFRMGLDGFYLLADAEQERAGSVNYRGHGVFGWDARGRCYTMRWFDSTGIDPGQPALGSWEDAGLTLVHETTYLGSSRYTFAVADGRLRVRIENSADGGSGTWRTFLEGTYTRVP